jgi:hypothetical protein
MTTSECPPSSTLPADFSSCSYVRGDTLALEEDSDMPRFLKRLDERGIPYRLREQHTNTPSTTDQPGSLAHQAPAPEQFGLLPALCGSLRGSTLFAVPTAL